MIVSGTALSMRIPTASHGNRPDPNASIDRGDDFVIATIQAIKNADVNSVQSAVLGMSADPTRFSSTLKLAQEFLESKSHPDADPLKNMEME